MDIPFVRKLKHGSKDRKVKRYNDEPIPLLNSLQHFFDSYLNFLLLGNISNLCQNNSWQEHLYFGVFSLFEQALCVFREPFVIS